MKKLFTLILSALMCTMVFAARPTGVVKKATATPPVIDGVIDAAWTAANKYNIDKNFKTELPTFGASGTTYWKALWDDNGMYVLVVANDDAWFPFWAPGGGANGWEYDKPELYFDTNYTLADGKGGQATLGNRQIAPDSDKDNINGQLKTTSINGYDVQYAYKVTAPTWTVEYFVPWDAIPDEAGVLFDKTAEMGFDVTLIDRDPGDAARKRAQWANEGAIDENWNNMDDAGRLTFDGAAALIYVDKITIPNGVITTDNGTLQMVTTIEPADASNKKVKWSIGPDGTGGAKISNTGLVTALKNGDVTIVADAIDGGYSQGTATVTISGQKIDKNDIWNSFNLISYWNFNDGKTGDWPTGWSGWLDAAVADQVLPVVSDGVVAMKCGTAAENWHYQLNQSNLTAEANVPYTFKFKSWATADNTPCAVDFEDTPTNSYTRYGITSDPEAPNGDSEWHYNVDKKPKWLTFHVTFTKMLPTTVQKIQWMNSLSNETVYLDSVLVIKDADLALKANLPLVSTMKVYPNPVGAGNELNVLVSSINSRVAIYNSIGQKIMERVAEGNMAKFNVASLRKGMYFVRLADGTTEKFIR